MQKIEKYNTIVVMTNFMILKYLFLLLNFFNKFYLNK